MQDMGKGPDPKRCTSQRRPAPDPRLPDPSWRQPYMLCCAAARAQAMCCEHVESSRCLSLNNVLQISHSLS